jgi:ATP-dependent DNA ligase
VRTPFPRKILAVQRHRGKVVALDASGRPSFSTLQNHGSANVPIIYYVSDVLVLGGRNVMAEPLSVRRELLRTHILPKLGEPIRHCPELNASLADVIASVRAAGLEGVVAKRLGGHYELRHLAEDADQSEPGVRV